MQVQDVLEHHKQQALKGESLMYKHAAKSVDHSRYFGREDDHRLPYQRDVDRIIHSKAYARYIDKTQVAYAVENDHVSHRVLHVQLVSNFARGIAEILRLNLALVEAIALGHDVGHPPFAHDGEEMLDALAKEAGEPGFAHSSQSCRLFREVEPLNLGLNVYDGFLCHDGGMESCSFSPNWGKSWEDHFEELRTPEKNMMPGTLEGCLVKLCDTASYLGRDIEDAIRLGLIKRAHVPETVLEDENRVMLAKLAGDIICNSYEQDRIALSEEMFEALKVIRAFNFEHIYHHPKMKVDREWMEQCYRQMFDILLADYEKRGEESYIWEHFLDGKSERYLENSNSVQKVIDYMAGMTDRYFLSTYEALDS